ncbi:MAG: tetratricopeptide repeat protein, partial [Candidatus Eremiobacteraeota bacterium]|nr:tetratricopeptide repeat protein [Candidatus Eremiobacteraeota bacterium]
DAFCAAFATPQDAVNAAIDAQRQLTAIMPVRMALHSGTAVEREGDYFGPTLNRVARLMSLAHGGQILLSGVTAAMLRDGLAQIDLRDLGTHRLRDLSEPERIFQAIGAGLPAEFPPLQSPESRPHNLPSQLTTFVGRERELRELDDALRATRLLTLTGPGGIGKTRLALEVGSHALDRFSNGVWFIDLSAIHEGARIPERIAAALSLQEQADRSHWDVALSYLRDKQLLLILDNCEHVIDDCAHRANEILQNAQAVHVLATSREPLSVPGERLWIVPSLLAGDGEAESRNNPAVRLFIERAMLTGRELEASDAALRTIAEICRCLDGIPLALELAASRAQSLTLEEIRAHLNDRFRFLSSGDRTRMPRQKTLRGAIDWSYELLDERDRTIFMRSAVFTGEFGLKAAEAICADHDVPPADVLDALAALVAKSFTLRLERNGISRYRLLETLREYAHEKLVAQDHQLESARRRHFDYFVAYAVKLERSFVDQPEPAVRALDADYENLRDALSWGFETGAQRAALLQLLTALSRYWEVRANIHEARLWFTSLLGEAEDEKPSSPLAAAFARAARLANLQGDYADAIRYGRVALRMDRHLRNNVGIADALHELGRALQDAGRPKQAAPLYREALKLYREQNNVTAQARLLANLGLVAQQQGDHQRALRELHESLDLLEGTHERRIPAFILGALGTVSHHAGKIQDALAYNMRSLEMVRALGDVVGQARLLNNLADVALDIGDLPAAQRYIAECRTICEESGLQHEYADVLDNLAILQQGLQRPDVSAKLIGAADAIRVSLRQPLAPFFETRRQAVIDSIQQQVGDEEFDRLRKTGEQADPKDVAAAALD